MRQWLWKRRFSRPRKELLGEHHQDTLRAMANLAVTYGNQGWWDEALVLCEEVLKVRKSC
jgi:hypothetical protein